MQALQQMGCTPKKGAADKLSDAEIAEHLAQLPGWERQGETVHKRFLFKDFMAALAFTNKLGEVAEAEYHHPDLTLGWGYVGVTMTTHDCGGLSINDMIMAAKIEGLAA